MKTQERIRATSPAKGLILSAVTLAAAVCLFLNIIPRTPQNLILLTVCILLILPGPAYHLLHATWLTPDGVEFCRLGHVLRRIPWSQTAQVCLIQDFRVSAKNSDPSRILIVPAGCPPYDGKKQSGLRYLIAHRSQVLWADNTPQNRIFIEQHCDNTIISWECL